MQKLHVFTNSQRDTKKSSSGSPCCCTRFLKFLRSTVSLIWPCTYFSIAANDTGDFILFFAESEVVYYGDSLAGEAECLCLDLCSVGFSREAG